MQIPFYKELLRHGDFSPNEKITYSFLLYKSLLNIDNAFDKENGSLNIDNIKEEISNTNYIPLYEISYRKLAETLSISPRSIMLVLKSLKKKKMIDGENIYVSLSIVCGGFFNLALGKDLKGELLIFYSYLKNKCEYLGGFIDMCKKKIAEDFCVTKIAITNLLNRLYAQNLAERTEDNKLKIN